jgi:restriction endonuclease
LQTPHSKEQQQPPSYFVGRVIVETLKQAKGDRVLSIREIAEEAKTTPKQVASILGPLLQLDDLSTVSLSNSTRFKLAFEAVRRGALQQVARALTWQEFETFTRDCLQTVGFVTQKGIMVKDDTRRWQIDLVAKKGPMILAIDCKHWESPGYLSKLSTAAEHQKLAVQALIDQRLSGGEISEEGFLVLPIILTLFEPRSRIVDGVVIVSIEQFADFLEGISPYSSELPFIPAIQAAKSSIS